ncbi:hypothetical protein ACIBG4_16030 [Nonomuraea sp. NPDC050383]|uniref:hypothetical protein n=1 Tax=Nonomuraea sp. NPDC050383 TaxID=3364362 RepID=UPI0037A3F01A
MGMFERIERDAGVSGLVEILAALAPSDLQSVLLGVYRLRADNLQPAQVLRRYEQDRFSVLPASDPRALMAFDLQAFTVLAELGFTTVELSPVCPLGTVSTVATVNQNKVVTTARNGEVVADPTNVLALEAAVRRRTQGVVRLATSHRVVRAQMFDQPGALPHFRLLALATAGRDRGSKRFELAALAEHLDAYLRLVEGLRVELTELPDGPRTQDLEEQVIGPLTERYPNASIGLDNSRESGRGYYIAACFKLRLGGVEVGDGGFTTWTRRLLGNAKERLLISALAQERTLQVLK